jgi:hypothetical protein
MERLNCLNELTIVFKRVLPGVGTNLRPLESMDLSGCWCDSQFLTLTFLTLFLMLRTWWPCPEISCGWLDGGLGLRFFGLLVAMFMMVYETSFGNVCWMVWERAEIHCSTLSNCWV